MRGVIFEAFGGPLSVEVLPDPAAPPDGVVIEVRATGLCRSDWHGWMGHDPGITLPHVPGHELAGEIVACGSQVKRWTIGDRVTVPFCVGCGVCAECRRGNPHICDDEFQPGFTAWGSFAEYVAIPHADANLVRIPDAMSFVDAASLGCRFVTSFRAITAQGQTTEGQWVAVHGCGGVGLSAIQIARALEARVIGVDIHNEALQMASAMGAEHVINSTSEPRVPRRIRELTSGGADVSIDALGSQVTFQNSIRCLRKQGRHVQVGLVAGEELDGRMPLGHVIAKELTIVGSHGMPAADYAELFALIDRGRLDPAKLVTRTISLDEVTDLLPRMGQFVTHGIVVVDRF